MRVIKASEGSPWPSPVDERVRSRGGRSARRADDEQEGRHGSTHPCAAVPDLGVPGLMRLEAAGGHSPS